MSSKTDNRVTIHPARIADSSTIARIHVSSWRTTYRGIVPASVLGTLDIEGRERMWRNAIADTVTGQFVYVAEAEHDGIVGFVAGGPERSGEYAGYTGEIYAIYLDEQWQGHGIGRQLLTTGVRDLLRRGHTSMLIWALSENPACGFYRRLGGEVVATQTVTMGRKTLEETAFGWKNIAMVVDDHEPTRGDG